MTNLFDTSYALDLLVFLMYGYWLLLLVMMLYQPVLRPQRRQ